MTISQWLRSRLAPRPASRRLACPPALERLEDRTTPSAVRLTPDNFGGTTNLTPVGSTLYFEGDGGSGTQLWRTNGRPGDAVPVDQGLNFVANGTVWRANGNYLVANDGPTQVGTWLYFFTDNGPNDQGVETWTLWRNDSTAAPTSASQAVGTFAADPDGFGPYGLTRVGHDLYFGAYVPSDAAWELLKVAGADAPSSTIPTAAPFQYPGADSNGTSNYFYATASYLYFQADAPGTTQAVLWGSDGTPGGTAPVLDSSGHFSTLWNFDDHAAVGSDLYALYSSGFTTSEQLWRFSGHTATEVQSNVGNKPDASFDLPPNQGFNMTAVGDALYFTSHVSSRSYDLWKCTGSTATDISPVPYIIQFQPSYPLQIVSVGTDVYVFDTPIGPGNGFGTANLWKWDGTSGGAEILKTFTYSSWYMPYGLTAAGATVYVVSPVDGQVWQSQGSPGSTQATGIFAGYLSGGVDFTINNGVPSTLAAIGSTLYFSPQYDLGSGGDGHGTDLWRVNSPPVANPDDYATDQDSTLTVSAAAGVLANDTDADAVDAGYLTAALVTDAAHGHVKLYADGSFTYTPAAGYSGPDSFTYQTSDDIDPSNVATVSLAVQPLQAALSGLATGGTLTVQTTAPDQAHDLIAAANALDPDTTPACTLVVDLGNQTIQDTIINVPPQVTVQFTNGTFIGGSPALVVSSGDVVIRNSTFRNDTNAATIRVEGGRLTLRGCDIESTGASPEAIEVTGSGTVDLGTTTDPGGNTIKISSAGAFASNTTSNPIPDVGETFLVDGVPLALSSLDGTVFEDFNGDGQVDFGENGIDGVTVTLTGTDFLDNAVRLSQPTSGGGAYAFPNLLRGRYTLTETQPAGYTQGIDSVGTAGGSLSGIDQFSVALDWGVDGYNYNYGERPPAGGGVHHGQTAGIGFWNNKNGQALIKSLPVVTNADGSVTSVANWLAATLPNTFGKGAANDVTGQSNAYIANLFQQDFVMKGVKLDAQLLATALSVYATNATLDPTKVAASYGFTVGGNGAGPATFNLGSNGDAFGVSNNSTLTLMDLLLAADARAVNGVLYNGNTTRRNEANAVFSAVNQDGGIN
jgi:hypothetical protein